MYSRREFGQLTLAGLPLALMLGRVNPTVNGVRLGAVTYSFHDLPNVAGQYQIDAIIQDCHGCDVGLLELMSNHCEPVSEFQAQAGARRGGGGDAQAAATGAATPGTPAATPPAAGAVQGGGGGRG